MTSVRALASGATCEAYLVVVAMIIALGTAIASYEHFENNCIFCKMNPIFHSRSQEIVAEPKSLGQERAPRELTGCRYDGYIVCVMACLFGLSQSRGEGLERGHLPLFALESSDCVHIPPGCEVQIIASEPMIKSPVAFDWGADGKLWVIEMRDYPHGHNGGDIRCLESTRNDGVYDKSTVFLDHLTFPNGIIPWRKGVIVSAGGEIFYAESTDGTGKTNVHKTILSGFFPGNPQHRVNGFDYGLDNWLYAANGDSGGRIRSFASKGSTPMRGCDLRFNPDTGEFQLEAGTSQYGRHRDDWGNWFGNHNVTWLWHYYLPWQYLRRNPYVFVRDVKQDTANYPDARRAFPISPELPRFNEPADTNQVTSGCCPMPYRDDLFGGDYTNSVFICDPAHNLIHREVLESDGVTFKSHRAASEQTNEFLSSTDSWFRPVYVKTGPDGALYVADMQFPVLSSVG